LLLHVHVVQIWITTIIWLETQCLKKVKWTLKISKF
jgi:hypothetical protein